MTETAKKTTSDTNRITLVMIFAIPVLIILASTLLYYLADANIVDLGTANQGTLITPPVKIDTLELRDAANQPFDYSQPEPRWSYLIVAGASCEDMCERMLYLTAQTHKLLGKNINQVRRIYVAVEGEVEDKLHMAIEEQGRSLQLTYADKQTVLSALAGLEVNPLADNVVLLVDPRGWVMMYYIAADSDQQTLSQLSKGMIKDIKRLIP